MQFRIQPVLQPNGAPFWSPILLIMSMTVATTPTTAIIIVTGTSAFIDAASNVVKTRCPSALKLVRALLPKHIIRTWR